MKYIIAFIVFLMLCSNCFATKFICHLQGGTWINNECVYNLAPETQDIKVFDFDEIVDTWFNLGEDASNNILALYETFGIYWDFNGIKYNKAVDIELVIHIEGFNFVYFINENAELTLCPSWFYYNTKFPTAKVILPGLQVSDVFTGFNGWVDIGCLIQNHENPCFYKMIIQHIYVKGKIDD